MVRLKRSVCWPVVVSVTRGFGIAATAAIVVWGEVGFWWSQLRLDVWFEVGRDSIGAAGNGFYLRMGPCTWLNGGESVRPLDSGLWHHGLSGA